uniref:F-box domain-containing protein n=1 Tax=Arion vulgaris TaxID=1028688 RepID=A0A0B7B585_9EUPU
MSRRARYNRHSRQGNLNRRSNGDPENQNNGSGRPQNTSSSQDVSVRVACGNSDDFAQTSQSQQMSMLPQIPVDSIVSHGPVTQVTNSHSSQRSVSHSNSDSTINTGPGNTSNISRSDQLDEEHQHECTILSLPDDVLFLICTYIQPKELCHMSCVCRRFQYLISKDTVWIQHAKVTAVVKNFPNW